MAKKKSKKSSKTKKKVSKSESSSVRPSVRKPNLGTDRDIAMDFATKVYEKFDKVVKAIVLLDRKSVV